MHCEICGSDQARRARLVPQRLGGPVAPWNVVVLCPAHRAALLAGALAPVEQAVLDPRLLRLADRYAASIKALRHVYRLLGCFGSYPPEPVDNFRRNAP